MTTVYVKEQGATVRRRAERLVISKGGAVLEEYPLAQVDQLVLLGNVQITTQAVATLLEREVDAVFMSIYGKFRGRLHAGAKQAQLRRQQYRFMSDEAANLRLAKAIVDGKIHNQRVLLQRQTRRTPSLARPDEETATLANPAHFSQALAGMMQMHRAIPQADNLDTLRGYEGKAAAYYFAAIRSLLEPDWKFEKRAFHPPPDPFNALLSFSYSLLQKDVEAAVNVVGLDAYLGCFHEIDAGRPSLALDLMEEWRPLIADALALELVNRHVLRPSDFTRTSNSQRPVELGEASMARVLQAYGARLEIKVHHPLAGGPAGGETSLRRAIELQARRLAHVVSGQTPTYEAMKAK
ncbi:MAG: CRISPR-associated endonuclease Cas1 [Chloroflexota bacterium]